MLHAQRYEGRFFGRRVNCEQVPILPAWAVAQVFDDPRETPYLLVWKSPYDGTVRECVHITPHNSDDVQIATDELRIWAERDVVTGEVEIKRDDGTTDIIRTLLRPLPRNGGSVRLLICPNCQIPRRGLYGWEPGGRFNTSVVRSNWRCRACHKLRYASEGGALVVCGRGAIARMTGATFGRRCDRPEPWYPDVFTPREEAAQAGV
jgi:hypothetical protein